jgi:hypothetical protein
LESSRDIIEAAAEIARRRKESVEIIKKSRTAKKPRKHDQENAAVATRLTEAGLPDCTVQLDARPVRPPERLAIKARPCPP